MKIIANKIQCKKCKEIIESESVHDYKMCKCKTVAVDGGKEYMKRAFPKWAPEDWYIELSHYIDDNGKEHNYENDKR